MKTASEGEDFSAPSYTAGTTLQAYAKDLQKFVDSCPQLKEKIIICLLKINVEHDFVCLCVCVFTVLCILYKWLQVCFFCILFLEKIC